MSFRYLLLPLCLFLTSCTTFDSILQKKPKVDWEAEKAKLEQKYKTQADAKVKEIEAAQKAKEEKEKANLTEASGLAYGILQLSDLKPQDQRSRPDSLINFKSKELVTRLPDLTTAQIMKINDELKKELDEKNTTIAQLQQKYSEAMAQANKDKEAIEAIKKDIENRKGELAAIEGQKREAQFALEEARRKQAELEARESALREQQAKERQELVKLLIKIFVGVGVGCALGAYAFKSLWLAAGAAGAFGLSVFIAFLEPWMVITAGTVIVVSIAVGLILKLNKAQSNAQKEKELADRLVGGLFEMQGSMTKEEYQQKFEPIIKDWIKDMPELEDDIQRKLKELNLA